MTEPTIVQFDGCHVEVWPDCLVTVFEDGLTVPAAGSDDEDSINRAHELGYAGDTWAMSRDHELCHHILAVLQGQPYSLVLRGVAVRAAGVSKELVISKWASDEEEALVLDFQRLVRRGISTPRLAASGIDLEAAAARLREVTG